MFVSSTVKNTGAVLS